MLAGFSGTAEWRQVADSERREAELDSGAEAQMGSRLSEKGFLGICPEKRCTLVPLISAGCRRSSLDTFGTKSHRAPHEAYEARALTHLTHTFFLTPTLPAYPSARDTAAEKSYARAVSSVCLCL